MEKELPAVSYKQFMKFKPCWADDEQGLRRLQYYRRKLGGKANALDILRLRRVSAENRLWSVLREEFIPAAILHEFACRCAERALELESNPDPRSVEAIEAKRQWLRGEITGDELAAAWDAARDAAWDAVSRNQVNMLINLLKEEGYA